jgi:hypothetical protein
VHVSGNEANFNEYSDTEDGIYGYVVSDMKDSYFMRFNANDIGYDTQLTLDGGMWKI